MAVFNQLVNCEWNLNKSEKGSRNMYPLNNFLDPLKDGERKKS